MASFWSWSADSVANNHLALVTENGSQNSTAKSYKHGFSSWKYIFSERLKRTAKFVYGKNTSALVPYELLVFIAL